MSNFLATLKNASGDSKDFFTKENLVHNYECFLKLKEIPYLLDPNNADIKRMGLHWESWKFKTIAENLSLIEDCIEGRIEIEDFFERFPKIEGTGGIRYDYTRISFCFKKGKSEKEIRQAIKKGIKSEEGKKEIIRVFDSLKHLLIEDDLIELKSRISEFYLEKKIKKHEDKNRVKR
jgi:hypothetical protein